MYKARYYMMMVSMVGYACAASVDVSADKRRAVRIQLAECLKPATNLEDLRWQGSTAADIYAARNNHGDVRLRVAMQEAIGNIRNPVVIDALIERLSLQKFYAQSVELASAFGSYETRMKFVRPAFARLQNYIKAAHSKEVADLYFEAFYNSSYRTKALSELALIKFTEGLVAETMYKEIVAHLNGRREPEAHRAANELQSLFISPIKPVIVPDQVHAERSGHVLAAIGAVLVMCGFAVR